MSRKSILLALALLIFASLALVACEPRTVEVIKTVEVITTQIVEGETIIVTATPDLAASPALEERSLVVCLGQEPNTLLYLNTSMLAASQVLEAIYDGPVDNRSFDYQPIILEKLPSLADGDAEIQIVDVAAGTAVVNDDGDPVVLAAGQKIRPAGCISSDCAIVYTEGTIQMDQLSATFKMLPGLLWSDGTPLTAADSVYGFELEGSPDSPLSKDLVERTQSYLATDDVTTIWTGLPGYLDSTYFINYFTPRPRHIWGHYTVAELITQVDSQMLYTGWGPYIITEWVRGDHITAVKNPNYFRAAEGLPNFESVTFRFLGATSNANITAILAGDCDIVDQTSSLDDQSDLLLKLDAAGLLDAIFITDDSWEHIAFNILPFEGSGFAGWDEDDNGFGPFADVRLRRAVAMCMDRQAVVDTVLFGKSIVLNTYLPPEHPLYNPDVAAWPFDVAAAAALLDEIGWIDEDGNPATPRLAYGVTGVPDGTLLEFKLETANIGLRLQTVQILADSMAQCGMKVNLDSYPSSEWLADGPEGILMGHKTDLGQVAWPVSIQPACELYKSDRISGPTDMTNPYTGQAFAGWSAQNNTGWGSLEYDAVCNAAIQALPGQPAYEESHLAAQAIFADQLPVVPLFLRLKLAATRPDMCNFFMDPTAASEMWNIEEFDYGVNCN